MSTTTTSENAETVITYEHDGVTYEIDHLRIDAAELTARTGRVVSA